MFSLNKNVLLCPFSLFVGEDDEWLNESNCEMIKKCLMDEWSTDPAVCEFKKIFRKKLFKSGKVATAEMNRGSCFTSNGFGKQNRDGKLL